MIHVLLRRRYVGESAEDDGGDQVIMTSL
jgi:hypothetical protein